MASMNIAYRLGNLMDHQGRFILHGCNAQGVMGSGVAKIIRALYPRCYEIYRARHEQRALNVGEVIVADCDRFVFFNGITQKFFGQDGKMYVDYDAMRTVMKRCDELLRPETKRSVKWGSAASALSDFNAPSPELAMPLIGAGLAGGDWKIISEIIQEEARYFKPVVYIVDPVQHAKIVEQFA